MDAVCIACGYSFFPHIANDHLISGSYYLFIYSSIHPTTYLSIAVALQGISDPVPDDATYEGAYVGEGITARLLPYVV